MKCIPYSIVQINFTKRGGSGWSGRGREKEGWGGGGLEQMWESKMIYKVPLGRAVGRHVMGVLT